MSRPERGIALGRHATRLLVLVAICLLVNELAPPIEAACALGCSGHGRCDNQNVCHCVQGYTGHSCAQRSCPLGKAWSTITGIDVAHDWTECSGRGICNEESGVCKCQQGFVGNACQFLDCPDSCGFHGNCISMAQRAQNDVISRELYDSPPVEYTSVWDAHKIRGCACDVGYFGASCAQKKCPVGDDPLTTGQNDEVQLIQCQTVYTLQQVVLNFDAPLTKGTFALWFGKQYTRPIQFQATTVVGSYGKLMVDALKDLQGVTQVTRTRTDLPNQISWIVQFDPTNPSQNAVKPVWKRLEVQQFTCAADSGTFTMTIFGKTISKIPYNTDTRTFISLLQTNFKFVGNVDLTLSTGATVCSSSGTTVTIRFQQLWHRNYFGDLPSITFTNIDNNVVSLLLNALPGFIDAESTEVVKGIDTCRTIETQQLFCMATSGFFKLTFEDGSKLTSIPYSITASGLESLIETTIAYIVDVDVSFSGGTTACSTTGTTITIAFVVVKSTGVKGDGDLQEIQVDKTNELSTVSLGLSHISNKLQVASAFTEVQKGLTCIDFDQGYAADPTRQVQSMVMPGGGGGVFTVSFRGFTTDPIPAQTTASELGAFLVKIPSINGVAVSYTGAQACEWPANIMSITFTQDFGRLPSLQVDGSRLDPLSQIVVATAGNTLGLLTSISGTKESDVCSNRGICDESKLGKCNCYTGYTNSDGRGNLGTLAMNRGDCGATSRIPVACPGDLPCSGHGTCSGSPSYRCTCAQGWRAGDCSERTCPFGISWFDYPATPNVAHRQRTECSSVGTCDRSTGDCKCPLPFTGTACELMACGGSTECSGNGQCLTLRDLAPRVTVNGAIAGYSYGTDPNHPATWDGTKIRACLCDLNFMGYDCSQRECPRGDDPGTRGDSIERQVVQCVATSGSFNLIFRDQPTPPIAFNADAATVKQALEATGTTDTVNVVFSVPTSGACSTNVVNNVISIDFVNLLGDLPSLQGDGSNLRDSTNAVSGTGSLSIASGGAMTLQGVASIKGTRENALCSNHGTCDFATGVCTCDAQYYSSDGNGGPGKIPNCGYHYVGPVHD